VARILQAVPDAWDDDLYKACVIPLAGYGQYGLFYSARNLDTWRVGYTEFTSPPATFRKRTSGASVTVPDLTTGEFEFRVISVNEGGDGAASLWVPVPASTEKTPLNLSFTTVNASTVTLDWESP
jgi:hypothetical protein